MARPTTALIRSLRDTANRLAAGADYQWGHMGACNCGHLAQTVTRLPRHAIHRSAMVREGDWEVQEREYCPESGLLIDEIIGALLQIGLEPGDIRDLERLSNPAVVAALPGGPRQLSRNRRDDAVAYLRAWADLLEAERGVALDSEAA